VAGEEDSWFAATAEGDILECRRRLRCLRGPL